jgi:hypothetical protein
MNAPTKRTTTLTGAPRSSGRRATRLAAAVCVLALAGVCLASCDGDQPPEKELRQEIEEEIEVATYGAVLAFELADDHGNPNRVVLGPERGQTQVRSADVAAAIAVLDSHRADELVLGNGDLRLKITVDGAEGPKPTWADWDRAADDPYWHLDTDDGWDWKLDSVDSESMGYGPWMCGLPDLVGLAVPGPGSDFSLVGVCSPALEHLSMASWDESTGHDGLGDLPSLSSLHVEAGLTDLRDLPALDQLEDLTLPDVADTPENRDYLASHRMTHLTRFVEPWPSQAADQT